MGKINKKQKSNRTSKKFRNHSIINKIPLQKQNVSNDSKLGQLKKKEKFENKRKNLMNKIDLIKKEKLVEMKRKRRQKATITGDLNLKQLKDALPSLDELLKLPRNEIKSGLKPFDEATENKKNKKNKRSEFMNRYKCFTTLLNDKDYKNNPRAAIAYHIQNSVNEN